jgi:prevent-host-death family protein
MTKTVSINDVQTKLPDLLALAREGDEIIIEENGEPLAKVTAIDKPAKQKQRTAGLGKGTMWMSDDFDDELPDEFWGFDKEL